MWKQTLTFLIALSIVQFSTAQKSETVTISGNVYNSDHKPVLGAVIYIDNIKTSNTTRQDGSYKIKVSSSISTLGVRSLEYGSAEKAIDGKKKIDFVLGEKTGETGDTPEEVVIEKPRRGKKMNTYNDIYQMIRSEVAGVVVSGSNIQIQQGHSFFGSSTPLFVVNGVIVSSIDNVNPVEVKSITVLKGSQAAIYGVRGSNGVISIKLINGSDKNN
jgi:TonB-dependent SusC/RagA subfamily outer membrane receptor